MVFFGLFSSQPEITIKLDQERPLYKRILNNISNNEIQSSELCPLIQDNDNISGRVIIRQKAGHTLEHTGVHIELVGSLEKHGDIIRREVFTISKVQLLAPMIEHALSKEMTMLDFDFGPFRFAYQSYDGNGVSLRYYLRAVIARRMSDVAKEMTLWCPGPSPPTTTTTAITEEEEQNDTIPIEMEVGLEEFLHIQLHLEKSRFNFCEQIKGTLKFLLVRIRVVQVRIMLVRKEFWADDQILDTSTMLWKQVVDGPAYKGDFVSVELDLASIADQLSPTMHMVNKMFSVKYYVGVVLYDAEGRKYYKQVEVELLKASLDNISLVNYKLGLIDE